MRYAFVEAGKIVEGPKSLPKAWRNVSGLCYMSAENLKRLGWLPWRIVAGNGGANKVQVASAVAVHEDEVVETYQWRDKTAEEYAEEAANRVESARAMRQQSYIEEADPLFFMMQRGEATMEDWLSKVQEIKARYPKEETQ